MTTRKIFVAALVWGEGEGGRWGNKTIKFLQPCQTDTEQSGGEDRFMEQRERDTDRARTGRRRGDGQRERTADDEKS